MYWEPTASYVPSDNRDYYLMMKHAHSAAVAKHRINDITHMWYRWYDVLPLWKCDVVLYGLYQWRYSPYRAPSMSHNYDYHIPVLCLSHQYSSYSTGSSVGVWYDECDTTSVIRWVWVCDTMQILWGKKCWKFILVKFCFWTKKKRKKKMWHFFFEIIFLEITILIIFWKLFFGTYFLEITFWKLFFGNYFLEIMFLKLFFGNYFSIYFF